MNTQTIISNTNNWGFLDQMLATGRQKKQEGGKNIYFNGQCLHLNCPECKGTGRKSNGQHCHHMISCRCRRCMPYSL